MVLSSSTPTRTRHAARLVACAFGAALAYLPGAASAQTITVCDAAAGEEPGLRAAIDDSLARTPSLATAELSVDVESCTDDGLVVIVRSGTIVLRRRMTRHGTEPLALDQRVALALDAMLVTLANARGVRRAPGRESLASLAAPPVGHPPRSEDGSPANAAVAPSTPDAVDVVARADDPDNERLTVALDGGLRLFRGGTGAYSFRIRTAVRWMFIDYRFLTTTVAGISTGDDVRLSQQSLGFGARYRARLGSRSTLSLGGSVDLGLSRAQGRTPGGSRATGFGAGTAGLGVDALLEVGAGRARFHLGVDAGVQHGIIAEARDESGDTVVVGSFNGVHFGVFAGVGIAMLKEGGRR